MLVLGIESSCDDTSVALYGDTGLVAHSRLSQSNLHAEHGGVVPELAARDHAMALPRLLAQVITDAGVSKDDIDLVACTSGPGLVPALKSGVAVAEGLAFGLDCPLMGINHLEGHLLSVFLSETELEFPWVSLLVSGGHTLLVEVTGLGQYRILGTTLDDAAGECLDKTARLLGLDYPGGVAIEKLAVNVDKSEYTLPRPMIHRDTLDFSFSGLKTAVFYKLIDFLKENPQYKSTAGQRQEQCWPDTLIHSMSYAIQEAVTDVLVAKSEKALKSIQASQRPAFVLVGGVAANKCLRSKLDERLSGYKQAAAPLEYCADNAAMIALTAWLRAQNTGLSHIRNDEQLRVRPKWPLHELQTPVWQKA